MILKRQQVSKEPRSSCILRHDKDAFPKAPHHSPNGKLLLTLEDPFQIWAPLGSLLELCQKQLNYLFLWIPQIPASRLCYGVPHIY